MVNRIRVLVAGENVVIRAGLTGILAADSNISVVDEAFDAQEVLTKAQELKPDVILMDNVTFQRCIDLEETASVGERFKVLVFSFSGYEEDYLQALRSGAQGCLLKRAAARDVLEAVRRVANGEVVLAPSIVARLVSEFRNKEILEPTASKLSRRESEILRFLGEGLTNSEIAERLFVSESSVRTYVHRVLEKLSLRNRAEAIAYSVRNYSGKTLSQI